MCHLRASDHAAWQPSRDTLVSRSSHTYISRSLLHGVFDFLLTVYLVYSVVNGPVPTSAAITGVGIWARGPVWCYVAPSDYNARWDEPGQSLGPENSIKLHQFRIDGNRSGFAIHSSCWSLVEEAYWPAPIPLQALFDLLYSHPIDDMEQTVSLGHDFGGVFTADDDCRYSWSVKMYLINLDPSVWNMAKADPFCKLKNLPQISDSAAAGRLPKGLDNKPLVPSSAAEDPFAKLPEEIILMIGAYLPLNDVLNLRLSTKAFCSILQSQFFWASRFHPDAERGWMFERRHGDAHTKVDYMALFRQLWKPSARMMNRRRVWGLIRRLQSIQQTCEKDISQAHQAAIDLPDGLHWVLAGGDAIIELWVYEGYRSFYHQEVLLPCTLSRIAFSTIVLGDGTYISGMRLTGAGMEEDISIGYFNEKTQVVVEVDGLDGFELAIGSRGIRGIRCVSHGGKKSQWAGTCHQTPFTRRLITKDAIAALQADFDVSSLNHHPRHLKYSV